MQDDFYTMVSMSIEAGRLALLRLLDNATNDLIEIAREGNGSERYTISISSENGGHPRRLTETDLQVYGRFLPSHVTSSVLNVSFGGWFRDRVMSRFAR